MPLLRARQVWPPPSAPRAQPVAKRAIRPELRFAELRRLRIPGKWIFVLGVHKDRWGSTCKQHDAPPQDR